MCALPSIAVFTSWGILFLPGISWRCFSRLLLVAWELGTTLALMFHILCIFNLRSWYFSIFSLSFSTRLCVYRLVLRVLLSSACLLPLSLVCKLVSVYSFWSWSPTVPWLCCSLLLLWACGARCYLSFWSRSAGICRDGLLLLHCLMLCLIVYKLPAILEHALTMWATVSSFSLHILHFGSFIIMEYFRFMALGVQCMILCCCCECFCFYLESCAFLHPFVSVFHWCDLR